MRRSIRGSWLQRRWLLYAVVLVVTGCHGWSDAPDGALEAASDAVFRLETRNHTRVPLKNVEVRGDSLYGENPSCHWKLALGSAPGRAWCSGIAIARADVVRTEVRVAAPYRTNVAILVFGLLWCAVMVACIELFAEARHGSPACTPSSGPGMSADERNSPRGRGPAGADPPRARTADTSQRVRTP